MLAGIKNSFYICNRDLNKVLILKLKIMLSRFHEITPQKYVDKFLNGAYVVGCVEELSIIVSENNINSWLENEIDDLKDLIIINHLSIIDFVLVNDGVNKRVFEIY